VLCVGGIELVARVFLEGRFRSRADLRDGLGVMTRDWETAGCAGEQHKISCFRVFLQATELQPACRFHQRRAGSPGYRPIRICLLKHGVTCNCGKTGVGSDFS